MRKFIILAVVLLIPSTMLFAQTEIPKAQSMFIYNFSRLIEWPAAYKSGDFVIGVVGNAKIFGELQSYTAAKKVGAQPIVVQEYADESAIGKCHILFVPFSKSNKMPEIISKVGNNSSLIIGEKKEMIESGAAVNFVIVGNTLKFELSPANASKQGLKVSSSLQQMAILK